mgnify:CR=1 FL=1
MSFPVEKGIVAGADKRDRETPGRIVEQGVKGKYSIVPYPACVGWLDRELPGWSRTELRASLKLVRDFMTPDWDIHPEMITHTRVMDIKTGRPLPQRKDGGYWMENGGWDNGRSLDEIADGFPGVEKSFAVQAGREALEVEGLPTAHLGKRAQREGDG